MNEFHANDSNAAARFFAFALHLQKFIPEQQWSKRTNQIFSLKLKLGKYM